MSDLLASTLKEIEFSIELIQKRFAGIKQSSDFLADENGLEKLDSISMRLIAIGEAFKNIDKLTDKKLLANYPQIDWKGIKGMRDILSHHYFDMDSEVIFEICDTKLDELLAAVRAMQK